MKFLNITTVVLLIVTSMVFMNSCSTDEFLDRPPEDSITLDNFFSNEEELIAATNALYSVPWFNFNNKAFWSISELLSGNARTFSGDIVNYGNFSITGDNAVLSDGWESLWGVVAQSNAIINFLPDRVSPSISQEVVNNTLGEAHFMRAVAYFYLVRTWGAVPIIENNLDLANNPIVNTNLVSDIYQFIEMDLQFTIDNCYQKVRGSNYEDNGHVSSGSARAFKAKIHLYQQEYGEARIEAETVINSGEFKLYGQDIPGTTYADLFLTVNNNNEESVFALQWEPNRYGTGNSMQASFALNSTITGTGDGFSVIGPTIDLQGAYEIGDLRRQPTIMLAGDVYPNILSTSGGFTVPDDVNVQNTRAAIKKYVVGTPEDNNGEGISQGTANNTYIMRYAEVLLIHAEAILAGGASTSDPAALNSFNSVRTRAGLGSFPSITFDDILKERRIELAIEGDYWFDLGRIDRSKAIDVISNQERGTFSNDDPNIIFSENYTPSIDDFILAYPASDVAINPLLLEPPVPYNFN